MSSEDVRKCWRPLPGSDWCEARMTRLFPLPPLNKHWLDGAIKFWSVSLILSLDEQINRRWAQVSTPTDADRRPAFYFWDQFFFWSASIWNEWTLCKYLISKVIIIRVRLLIRLWSAERKVIRNSKQKYFLLKLFIIVVLFGDCSHKWRHLSWNSLHLKLNQQRNGVFFFSCFILQFSIL